MSEAASTTRPFDGLICDLDGTFYALRAAEEAGLHALAAAVSTRTGMPHEQAEHAYRTARNAVKSRIHPTGAFHSRLLYAHEVACTVPGLTRSDVAPLTRAYWDAYLGASPVDQDAIQFLGAWRAGGGRIVVATDLTLDIQLRKLADLGIDGLVDALCASEEVDADKPDPSCLRLAARRAGLDIARCAVVGDDAAKDGGAARTLGIPFFRTVAGHDDPDVRWATLARRMGWEGSPWT